MRNFVADCAFAFQVAPPERLAQARREIRRYSEAARQELDSEIGWLLNRFPTLNRKVAGYVAWARLRNGISRHNQGWREAKANSWATDEQRMPTQTAHEARGGSKEHVAA